MKIEPTQIQNARSNGKEFIPKPYLELAEKLEKQFYNLLLNEMEKTVEKTEPQSTAEEYYNSLLSDKHAEIFSQNPNNNGIKDLILNEVYPQRFRSKAVFEHYNKEAQRYSKNSSGQGVE